MGLCPTQCDFCEKKKMRKKYGYVVVAEELLPGYFRTINNLWLILYSIVLCNYSRIHSKTFSSTRGFSCKSFHVKSWCFSLFLYFIIVSLISTYLDAIR